MFRRTLLLLPLLLCFVSLSTISSAQSATLLADRIEISPEGTFLAEGSVEIFVKETDAEAARDLIAKAERGELVVPDVDPDQTPPA